jgi:hypothetical protein
MHKVNMLNQKIRSLGINIVAENSGLNKSTISRYVNREREYSLENYEKVLCAVKKIEMQRLRGRTSARLATQRVWLGEEWRISYFDFVDSFLAIKSEILISERPVDGLDIRSLALICSIVMQLCDDAYINPPEWAKQSIELEEPWFISRFKNLRAISLVESSIFFKRNNIFVGNDFLKRV